MGRDFSYKIVSRYYVIPKEEDYDSLEEYWVAYSKHRNGFEDMYDGRNSWDGPFGDHDMYTRDEMIESLQSYINDRSNLDSWNMGFTLKTFGQIISEMDKDSRVIICYS